MPRLAIQFWVLIAFNIAAMCFIVRGTSFALTVALVSTLLLTNILLGMVLRRTVRKDSSQDQIIGLLRFSSWIDYFPVLGGMICVLIGFSEFSWKPCVIGTAAIAIGVWRIWAKGRVQQAIDDRH